MKVAYRRIIILFIFIAAIYAQAAFADTDTRLLLHFNGATGATDSYDSSASSHTINTPWYGNARLSDAQKKWGATSLFLDGSGDYLTLNDSNDWDILNETNATIHLWVRYDTGGAESSYLCHYGSANDYWLLGKDAANHVVFRVYSGGSMIINMASAGTLSTGAWHHVALCKVGDDYGIYIDGSQEQYFNTPSSNSFSGLLRIGSRNNDLYHNGYLDEICLVRDNFFSAAPAVDNSNTISVPRAEFFSVMLVDDFNGPLRNFNLLGQSTGVSSDSDNSSVMVDNFADWDWGHNSLGFWTGTDASCSDGADPVYPGMTVRKLTYSGSKYYCTNLWEPVEGGSGTDYERYDVLAFYVRGGLGGEKFKIKISYGVPRGTATSTEPYEELAITDFINVTTQWQEVRISLDSIAALRLFNKPSALFGRGIRAITFSLINDSGAPNTLYIDDIRFVGTGTPETRDHMIKLHNYNSLLWEIDGRGEKICRKTNLARAVPFDVAQNSTFSTGLIPGIGIPKEYNYLAFRIMGTDGADFFVQMDDGTADPPEVLTSALPSGGSVVVAGGWRMAFVPLSDFAGLNKSSVRAVKFIFKNGISVPNGKVYVDDIQFYCGFKDKAGVYKHLKPQGTGSVRIAYDENSVPKLQIFNGSEYEDYKVKGLGYQATPIGQKVPFFTESNLDTKLPWDQTRTYRDLLIATCNRDFPLIKDMGCNTVRTWGDPTSQFMALADAPNVKIKVIVDFSLWVNHPSESYSKASTRKRLKDEFRSLVRKYKKGGTHEAPALLMWGLGNEDNLSVVAESEMKDLYSLIRELAEIAYDEEVNVDVADPDSYPYHPVMPINGELDFIGFPREGEYMTADLQMDYVDIWGSNLYARNYEDHGLLGEINKDLFNVYTEKSAKPLIVTEYGTDVIFSTDTGWRHAFKGREQEVSQAQWVKNNYEQIMNDSTSKVVMAGCVFEYQDEWWKHDIYGSPGVHDKTGKYWKPQASRIKELVDSSESIVVDEAKIYFTDPSTHIYDQNGNSKTLAELNQILELDLTEGRYTNVHVTPSTNPLVASEIRLNYTDASERLHAISPGTYGSVDIIKEATHNLAAIYDLNGNLYRGFALFKEWYDSFTKSGSSVYAKMALGDVAELDLHDHVDGYASEEYFGIMQVAPDGTWSAPDKVDDIKPRQLYSVLRDIFREDKVWFKKYYVEDDWFPGNTTNVNGDKYFNPGETIDMPIEVTNVHQSETLTATAHLAFAEGYSNPYIHIEDADINFSAIQPGQTVISSSQSGGASDVFRVRADNQASLNGHMVQFIVTITAAGKTWDWRMPVIIKLAATAGVPERELSLSTTSGDAWSSRLCYDNSGHVYVMWADSRSGAPGIYFRRSDDFGQAWYPEIRLYDSDRAYKTSIICDNYGHVYAVWTDGNIRFKYSKDYGATWSSVRTFGPDYNQYFPFIACDNNGYVYLAWTDARNSQAMHGPDVYYNYSTNYGYTWQDEDIRVDNGSPPGMTAATCSGLMCYDNGTVGILVDNNLAISTDFGVTLKWVGGVPGGTLQTDKNGRIYALWDNNGEIYFSSSTDYGVYWPIPIKINFGDYADRLNDISGKASLSFDGRGHVYVAWSGSNGFSGARIFFNKSDDYGVTWLSDGVGHTTFLDTQPIRYACSVKPMISCDDEGGVYVMWMNNRDGKIGSPTGTIGFDSLIVEWVIEHFEWNRLWDIYFNYSSDNGAAWQGEERINGNAAGTGNSFVYALRSDEAGKVYMTWMRDDDDWDYDVYFSMRLLGTYMAPVEDQVAKGGEPLQFEVTATQTEKQEVELFYDISALSPPKQQAIANATFEKSYDPVSGQTIGIFRWTPDESVVGDYGIKFVARDQKGRLDHSDMTITVAENRVLMIDDYNDGDPGHNSIGFWTGGGFFMPDGTENSFDGSQCRKVEHAAETWYASSLWDGVAPMDIDGYNYLAFDVKGSAGGENFILELQYGTDSIASISFSNISAEWKNIIIPLSQFDGLDKSSMRAVSMVFHEAGTFYLDNLRFLSDNVLSVEPGLPIKAAIEGSTDGTTLVLRDGTYIEDINVENKNSLTMRGESNTSTRLKGNIIVTNSGFELENITVEYKDGSLRSYSNAFYDDLGFLSDAGITAIDSDISIKNCIIMPDAGIFGESKFGKGIQIWNLYGTADIAPLIENNAITNTDSGIYLFSQSYGGAILGSIKNNTLDNNNYGVVLRMHKENPLIDSNVISNSTHGIHITYRDGLLYDQRLGNIVNPSFLNNVADIWCDEQEF